MLRINSNAKCNAFIEISFLFYPSYIQLTIFSIADEWAVNMKYQCTAILMILYCLIYSSSLCDVNFPSL